MDEVVKENMEEFYMSPVEAIALLAIADAKAQVEAQVPVCVVKENMEEFDMSPEEAIADAAQFEAQVVDLSNIIKDLALHSGDVHIVTTILSRLSELCAQNAYEDGQVLLELDKLKAECEKEIAHRVRAGNEGAYNVLINLLESRQRSYVQEANDKDSRFIIKVLETLVSLMNMQTGLLEQRGVDLIKSTLDKIDDEDIIIPLLKWVNVCCIQHERNRQRIFQTQIGENLLRIIKSGCQARIVSEAMRLVRKFTWDDDVFVEFGKAHERARELGIRLLEPLTTYLKANTKPPVVSEVMLTIAALLVAIPHHHELCAAVVDAGADATLFAVLADNFDDVTVATQASKLITALAGNDDVKRKLMKAGLAPIIVSLLSRHAAYPTTAALILKCIAALVLREPDHSRQFFDCGAPEAIVECMKIHPIQVNVQKFGCWAIRNMVARCPDQNSKFHELGVEPILNEAYHKFAFFLASFGFDIKSALRDLECDVKLDGPGRACK